MIDRGYFYKAAFKKLKEGKANSTQARIYNPEFVTEKKKWYPYKRGTKTDKTSFYDVFCFVLMYCHEVPDPANWKRILKKNIL